MSWLKKLIGRSEVPPPSRTIMELVDHEREAYQTVLMQLHAQLRSMGREVFSEIQIKLGEENAPEPYCLMRLDALYKEGEKVGTAEANINNPLRFDPLVETWSTLRIEAHPLVWNGIEFRVAGPLPDDDVVFAWLERWYDRADTGKPDSNGLLGVVHNVTQPQAGPGRWEISIDFGSASIQAFTDFIELVKGTGATSLTIGSSSYAPAASAA
jgi:hypothetical protein